MPTFNMIIQDISKDGKTDFSFTLHRNDYARTVHLLKNKLLPSLGTESPRRNGAMLPSSPSLFLVKSFR
jgi:hypothetical protein